MRSHHIGLIGTGTRATLLATLLLGFGPWRKAHPADNREPAIPQRTLATLNGQPIREEDLVPLVGAQILRLRTQEYQLKRRAVEELIRRKLLAGAAAKLGISPDELLKREVDAQVAEPAEAEIEAFYLTRKDQLGRPLAEVRPEVAAALKGAKTAKVREEFFEGLRKGAKITWSLEPPRVEVAHDPDRVLGDPAAPITIVEFSDFECPYCRKVQPVLKQLLSKYEGRVKLSFRDYPLSNLHPQASKAAEAARCAGEQGKFWEYHDLLFAAARLDPAGLTEHARTLELNDKQFDSCLETDRFKAKVEEGRQAGSRVGINGTPAFFINGVFLNGAQPASAFESLIDGELERLRTRGTLGSEK